MLEESVLDYLSDKWIICEYLETLANDMECFARHGGREEILPVDVLYCSTKNARLVVVWNAFDLE